MAAVSMETVKYILGNIYFLKLDFLTILKVFPAKM